MSTNKFRPTRVFDQLLGMSVGALAVAGGVVIAMNINDDRPPTTITIPEDYDVPFDAKPGDVLNVVMTPSGDMLARCDWMGGVLVTDTARNITTCQGVDF